MSDVEKKHTALCTIMGPREKVSMGRDRPVEARVSEDTNQ